MNTAVPLKSAKAETLRLPDHRDAFYGGEWHKPKSGRYVDSINPGTAESLGPVADCGAADIDAAVAAAKKAFDGWRNTPPLERARLLKRIANVLREHADELAMIDAADCGNPVHEMVMDATIAAAQIEFYAGLVTEMKGSSIPMGPGVVNFSVREPRGVVGRIIPFNHPFMFCAGKAGAPLATGNTVVMKPPEQAPLSSLRLAELIGGILPPGVFNVVPGGREAGSALTTHPDVAMIALIGSVPTGRAVMKAAADTLKPVMLELGGKNALIAFPDADPDEVAGGVVGGMNFTWCGQSCGSTSRAFIHEKIYDAVLAKVKTKIAHFKPGIATDRSTTMGAIISKAQYERILGFIESAKQEGARLLHGGGRPADPALAQGLFHRADRVRRRAAEHAHRARGDFRPGPLDLQMERRSQNARRGQRGRIRPHRLDLDQRSVDRAPHRRRGAGRLRVDQRSLKALPRRAVRRLQAIRHRPRGMFRGNAGLHAGKEHPREAEAGEVLASFRGRAQRGTRIHNHGRRMFCADCGYAFRVAASRRCPE